jgi:hypothetical protein
MGRHDRQRHGEEDPQMLAGCQMFRATATGTNNRSKLIIFTGLPP